MDARFSYREAAARGASGERLVVLLYEQAIEDLGRAVAASEQGDIEARTHALNHAVLVIGHLQNSLDMDQGGAVAKNLERFYLTVRNSLIEAQCQQSISLLKEQIAHLMLVRDAWLEVERATTMPVAEPADASQVPQAPGTAEWRA